MKYSRANIHHLLAALALLAALLVADAEADAHGVWGHIHVTGWAIENLPEGELRELFSDPEVMNAALYGAAFTDSGYWPQGGELSTRSRAYTEHTHWEPFIRDFVAWIVANDPPPWDNQESKKRVAFLMGCASHGLQDEIFDSLFLYQAQEHDGAGQSEADPATDGFLALDRRIRFVPTEYIPMETLLELYANLTEDVDEEVIRRSVELLNLVYLGNPSSATYLGRQYQDVVPWIRSHYLDPAIPGSLHAEVYPTMRYLEALWARLHGTLGSDELVVFAYPEAPRPLPGADPSSADSWVTLVFGAALRYTDTAPAWTDDNLTPIPFQKANTRWGNTWPRLIRMQPSEPLVSGGHYTVSLASGAEVIDGFTMDAPFSFDFQVACDVQSPELCGDPGEIPVADIGEPQPEEPDAGVDAPDELGLDAEAPDADEPLEDVPADEPDAEEDAADNVIPPDTDTRQDASGVDDNALPTADDEGCGCKLGVNSRASAPSALLLLLSLVGLYGLTRGRSRI